MKTKEMVKEIVDYMVEYGTEHTNYGNWIFDVPELCEHFDLKLVWFKDHNDDILEELYNRDAVCDVNQEFDYNIYPTNYDVNFYTSFCGLEN